MEELTKSINNYLIHCFSIGPLISLPKIVFTAFSEALLVAIDKIRYTKHHKTYKVLKYSVLTAKSSSLTKSPPFLFLFHHPLFLNISGCQKMSILVPCTPQMLLNAGHACELNYVAL